MSPIIKDTSAVTATAGEEGMRRSRGRRAEQKSQGSAAAPWKGDRGISVRLLTAHYDPPSSPKLSERRLENKNRNKAYRI